VLLITGRLAGAIGRMRFFAICLAAFIASSVLCGLTPLLAFLIVARIVQGAGGGGLQPIAQAILADSFAP
jgi:DHA2 family multidrug resistance protein